MSELERNSDVPNSQTVPGTISIETSSCETTVVGSDEASIIPLCREDRLLAPKDVDSFAITIKTLTGRTTTIPSLQPTLTIADLKSRVHEILEVLPKHQRIIFKRECKNELATLQELGITANATVYLILHLRGKPVIYVKSPKDIPHMSIYVELRERDWEFSCVYPMAVSTKQSRREVKWDVSVRKDTGVLVEKNAGIEVTYLYWEAVSIPPSYLTPPPSPNTLTSFRSSPPLLQPSTSVLIPTPQIAQYLDKTLQEAFTFDTSARTSFLTYWLPSFLKDNSTHILFTFLPQKEYDEKVPMKVNPKPDVVLRVFMVFRTLCFADEGQVIEDFHLEEWNCARKNAKREDLRWWREIVSGRPDSNGFNWEAVGDERLVRVLEWGGMEVWS